VKVDGKIYSLEEIAAGIPIRFSSRETKSILVKAASI